MYQRCIARPIIFTTGHNSLQLDKVDKLPFCIATIIFCRLIAITTVMIGLALYCSYETERLPRVKTVYVKGKTASSTADKEQYLYIPTFKPLWQPQVLLTLLCHLRLNVQWAITASASFTPKLMHMCIRK